MTLINQAIADTIRDALIASSGLSDVKVFVRGHVVAPMPQDLYPFCEIIIGEETGDNDLTGGTYERSYAGLITFTTLTTQTSVNDWSITQSRKANSASYDTIAELINAAMLELQRETRQDLGELSVTNTFGSFSVVDVVRGLRFDSTIAYGLEDRGQNYENFGSLPFVVLTERTIYEIPA